MILLVHMLFGAAVGYKVYSLTNSIWLAGFLALASHYFSDLFPHAEYLTSVEDTIKSVKNDLSGNRLKEISMVLLDFFLGFLFIFIVSTNQFFIYLFAFLALIPDGLTIVNSLFKIRILEAHQWFHGDIVQYLTKNKKFPVFWRIFTQVLAVLISIYLLGN